MTRRTEKLESRHVSQEMAIKEGLDFNELLYFGFADGADLDKLQQWQHRPAFFNHSIPAVSWQRGPHFHICTRDWRRSYYFYLCGCSITELCYTCSSILLLECYD